MVMVAREDCRFTVDIGNRISTYNTPAIAPQPLFKRQLTHTYQEPHHVLWFADAIELIAEISPQAGPVFIHHDDEGKNSDIQPDGANVTGQHRKADCEEQQNAPLEF
jgi:hypothetical protein